MNDVVFTPQEQNMFS